MIIPLRTDSPLRSTPWMNWAIIAANVIVFLIERRNPALEIEWALNPRDPHLGDYLTYMWLHANVGHLVMNMLFLYIFGNNVNDRMGHVGYLGFYLAGGVFAGVGHAITTTMPVVGASGAVAAVTGAYLVLFPRSSITVIYLLFFIGTIEIPSMWFVAFFFVKDVLLNFSAEPTGTAHMAHVSGTLFGFGVCFALLSAQLLPRDQFDVVALVQRWNKRRQYRDMVSRGYDPFGYIPPSVARTDEATTPPDPTAQKIQDLRAEISEAVAHHNHPRAALLFQELKRLDPQQVLSRQAQLEVANQLASQQLYHEAADAYEQFIKHYANFEQIEQVELMLGLIYARYLEAYEPAREYLLRAMARLHGEREVSMARTELARIEALLGPRTKK